MYTGVPIFIGERGGGREVAAVKEDEAEPMLIRRRGDLWTRK